MQDLDELNVYRSAKGGPAGPEPEPEDEAAHFYVCKCGQAVDRRRLGDVFHHMQEDHQPLPADS
jgi:hypothetical protein